ncbi:hypothetical protein STCU_05364 [Strigomonas culicis]|uniref:Uncharacterized protein n=1 Tax=Strigomonas culicis TaxID=28005 RepID=S9U452_9TRYP|nr:hypothetical protein STCU_06691 [Strigomonas culicis]EPY27975.1 hypothetical protein STCU_05364 [Strigomonas culicis]|eukprot:EPY25552.1 hypothetical protein STCU_06691 [Strigomonas culicis]
MKSRRKHYTFNADMGPVPFDYTLLSELYIHHDGDDVLHFGGFDNADAELNGEATTLARRKSPTADVGGADGTQNVCFNGTFIQMQADVDDAFELENTKARLEVSAKPTQLPTQKARRIKSKLVNVEDTGEHIWFVVQPESHVVPYARQFRNMEKLLHYIEESGFKFPGEAGAAVPPDPNVSSPKRQSPQGRPFPPSGGSPFDLPDSYSTLPTTKWIDVQKPAGDTLAADLVTAVLSRFPVHQHVVDHCIYIQEQDRVDTTHLYEAEPYLFFTLTCTPITKEDGDEAAGQGGGLPHPAVHHNINTTKSIMELRFDAVREGRSRSSVVQPVGVAVVAFYDWIITIHEEPFAEMDDLLRMIEVRCSPPDLRRVRKWHPSEPIYGTPSQRYTTPFVFTSLLQITVGHHLDTISLTEAVDDLWDTVFVVQSKEKDQKKVLRHITEVRRCFGECSIEATRRENIVTSLMQPQLAGHFLLTDTSCQEQFTLIQQHLRRIQHELNECRDSVAVSNWYYNVAHQWYLLTQGNRALRMLVLLTEITNIMYPILIVQTLYAMNMLIPFDSEGDSPNTSLAPFCVLAALIVLYMAWGGRAFFRICNRKHFKTKLLA